MQSYMYDKAMAPETRNGGTSTFNNNGTGTTRRKLLIVLDIICLLLGECCSRVQRTTWARMGVMEYIEIHTCNRETDRQQTESASLGGSFIVIVYLSLEMTRNKTTSSVFWYLNRLYIHSIQWDSSCNVQISLDSLTLLIPDTCEGCRCALLSR